MWLLNPFLFKKQDEVNQNVSLFHFLPGFNFYCCVMWDGHTSKLIILSSNPQIYVFGHVCTHHLFPASIVWSANKNNHYVFLSEEKWNMRMEMVSSSKGVIQSNHHPRDTGCVLLSSKFWHFIQNNKKRT